MSCPRCSKNHYNTFKINRYNIVMPVNKCLICGFLWIEDKDILGVKGLAKAESKKIFIDTLRNMGKYNDTS